MSKVDKSTTTNPALWRLVAGGTLVCMALLFGCPAQVTPIDNTNTNANDNTGSTLDDVGGEILSFPSNVRIPLLGGPVSVIYTVTGTPDTLQGYYVRMETASSDSLRAAEPVPLATGLSTGTFASFDFDPAAAGVGYYRVGVVATVGEDDKTFESTGTLVVEGAPDPIFILPVTGTQVPEGDDVEISFDVRDPEGQVYWRLFYLSATDARDASPEDLGTELLTGQGNAGTYTFSTTGLITGTYEIGLSATDSGSSVAATVLDGKLSQIVTIGNEDAAGPTFEIVEQSDAMPPTIQFLEPGSSDIELYGDELLTLQFLGAAPEPGATGSIDLFVDLDRNVSNGVTTFAEALPVSTTTYDLPTDLAEGTYNIGATIRDDINDPVTVYATGQVIVVREVTVEVTEPNTPLPIPPTSQSSPSTVDVVWSTNAPLQSGTVDVYARKIDESGSEYGEQIRLLTNADLDVTSTEFSPDSSGLYQVTVRVELIDGTSKSDTSPQPLRVSSLPAVLWVGSLAEEDSLDGAVFEGHNFEDNAGSVFSTAGDMNGDGNDEFVIGARYGKPFFQNASGIGPGEAYVILGQSGSDKLTGPFELNSVGTSLLEGVTLTGIPTIGNSDDTEGLVSITRIPDADNDDLGELAFGFPNTDSAAQFALEADGQFLRGGVVIVSSKNTTAWSPTSSTRVIDLADVGQVFTDMTPTPATVEDTFADQLTYQEQDGQAGQCVGGTDGVYDTLIGPGIGFIAALAPPVWEQLGFQIIAPNAPVGEGECPTQYADTDCQNPGVGSTDPFGPGEHGSGFYPNDAEPVAPYGARILGVDDGDGFGASIAFASNSLGDDSPGDLIITAPNRMASAADFDATLLGSNIPNSGVGFLFRNRLLWDVDDEFGYELIPPFPHQYMVNQASHCGDERAPNLGQLAIAGDLGDNIHTALGIDDFNGDGRTDFAIAAPEADGGRGRVYVAYRRDIDIEGDFVLNKLLLIPDDPERLSGVLITTDTLDNLGFSMATGVDFNGDGVDDLAIGSPEANNGEGEVVIIFGGTDLVTGENGTSVSQLLESRTGDTGAAVAARITGNSRDPLGAFGYNIANAGDLDGDGTDDLLVAAPNATPRHDPDPTDEDDELTADGLDLDFDGVQDDLTGPLGVADGTVDTHDNLEAAGIVYVIYGSNRLDQLSSVDKTVSIEELGGTQIRGFMIAGRRAGDRLGGGDAGDTTAGGIGGKREQGRSFGLATAGDVDGDGRADLLIGSVLADPRVDPVSGQGTQNAGEAYLIYGTVAP